MTGDFENGAHAGQGVDKIDAIVPAGERLKAIISEATRCCSLIPGWREVCFGSLADIVPFLTRPRRSRTIEPPCREERMDKPRIFLGSSGMQKKLLQALTRGLEDVAHVDPWTTSFNPGTTTLDRLFELAHEVDFAAFAFARDDWTTTSPPASPPRDPVRLLRETMSSSKPAFSVASSECAEPSSSMRAARSFRAISSGLHAYGTAKRRTLPR